MPNLRPGNLSTDPVDYAGFDASMAEAIEEELDALLALDGLPALSDEPADMRARRRFIIAIARGVVRHLVENNDAFVVEVEPHDPVHPDINAEQL